jgi:CheY-like chemotaxis protein
MKKTLSYDEKVLPETKVLLAEDNEINIMLFQEYMRCWNIECDVAENGLVALQKVKENKYNMVFMDLQMPEMDGYQATENIRQVLGKQYAELPIIALTASNTQESRDKAQETGMNDYITKPINASLLQSLIQKYSNIKFS